MTTNKNINNPFVSVIIPCFNDEKGIYDTLESISLQDYPGWRWEVIVVDNNSSDNTAKVAKSFQTDLPSLKVIHESKQSSYAARNRGIRIAKGEILAFIDADMTVTRSWLSKGVASIVKSGCDYSGCRIIIYPQNNPPTACELFNIHTGFKIQQNIEKDGYAPTACLFVRRDLFNNIGFFDEQLFSGGDREFGNRVRDNGFTMYYDHYNIMKHPARSSIKSIWSKYIRIGKGRSDLEFFFPDRYEKKNINSLILNFRPIVSSKGIIDNNTLNIKQNIQLVFIANIMIVSYTLGQVINYICKSWFFKK